MKLLPEQCALAPAAQAPVLPRRRNPVPMDYAAYMLHRKPCSWRNYGNLILQFPSTRSLNRAHVAHEHTQPRLHLSPSNASEP